MTSPDPHDSASDPDDDPATKDAKRRERLEQNRISARESRKRKKNMIEELQRTVITLSRENKELNERNEGLRRELVEIGTKNPGVVNVQALMSCSGASSLADGGGAAVAAAAATAVGDQGAAPVPDAGEGGGDNPQAAQQQAAAAAAMGGANPQQQIAMMQQMMALQQAGMMPNMMGMMQQMNGQMGQPPAAPGTGQPPAPPAAPSAEPPK